MLLIFCLFDAEIWLDLRLENNVVKNIQYQKNIRSFKPPLKSFTISKQKRNKTKQHLRQCIQRIVGFQCFSDGVNIDNLVAGKTGK